MSDKDVLKKKIDAILKELNDADEKSGKEIIWVCSDRSLFPDDVKTKCEKCGRIVYHRPYARGRKLCMKCAEEELGISAEQMLAEFTERIISEIRKTYNFFAM